MATDYNTVNYEAIDSRCNIEIVSVALAAEEPEFFAKVLAKLARHATPDARIRLVIRARSRSGFLEWGADVSHTKRPGGMYIGIIQREAGGDPEFNT